MSFEHIQNVLKQLESSQLFKKQEPLYDEMVRNYHNQTEVFSKESIEKMQALFFHSEAIQKFIDEAIEITKSPLPHFLKQEIVGRLIENITLLEFNLLCLYLNIQAKIYLNFPEEKDMIARAFFEFITASMRVTAAEIRKQKGGSL